MVLPHLKNWSLNNLRLKCQSQYNKTPALVIQLWSSWVNQDVFSHLPGNSYRLLSLPRAVHPALGGGVPEDSSWRGWGGEPCHVQGLESQQPSCCVAFCGSSANLAQKITGCQLSVIQGRSTPHWRSTSGKAFLGIGAEASMHSHVYYYLQSYLESR